MLVLHELSSTLLTGRSCPLAARGHSRDGEREDAQTVFGSIRNAEGCPIAVEVLAGNTADSATVAAQAAKLGDRFGIAAIVWVGAIAA
jgi:transposase